jgi:hypothetical protein
MSRSALTALVVMGLIVQTAPAAWAQLETVDPALHAAVEAMVMHDPALLNDPELAELCRDVAEATILDPRERAAVTYEAAQLEREGVNLETLVPEEVRDAAREQFTRVQGELQAQLETLRATDPEAARELELTMREGEQCMLAFERGEQYVPSAEMVAHAEEMFREWETDMSARGVPAEVLERAREEFTQWSGGEHMAYEGMGAGHEMPAGGFQMEGWESAFAGYEGPIDGMEHVNFEAYGSSPMEAFEAWAATEGSSFSAEEMEHFREMADMYQSEFENQNYDSAQSTTFDSMSSPSPSPSPTEGPHTQVGFDPGPNENWDGNDADSLPDHMHPDGTAPHNGP